MFRRVGCVGALLLTLSFNPSAAGAAEVFPADVVARTMAASVRLRVTDDTGRGYATGTIIARQGQQALVVTCGHVFRDSQGRGLIEVDTFGSAPHRELKGELIGYDEKRDVGLVAVEIPGEFEPAPLAPPEYSIATGAPLVSVGCDHGADPTPRVSRLNGTNKFVGPPNLQVAGQPVQGRSGGGLFSIEGYLIGVCNAADPQDDEGLYSAATNVHEALAAHDVRLHYSAPVPTAAVAAQTVSQSKATPPAPHRNGAPALPPRPRTALLGATAPPSPPSVPAVSPSVESWQPRWGASTAR